jgi:asparagine synthase (glutamine-hydrolysing)
MCGISGLIKYNGDCRGIEQHILLMTGTLVHRGPDDSGVWIDKKIGVAFAHRRLSVLDLSPAGHQSMESCCGRYVIVFNGEIYNHQTLRSELEHSASAPPWRGHSDTETLLAAFACWGGECNLAKILRYVCSCPVGSPGSQPGLGP